MKIIKRDKTVEEFDIDKIFRVVQAAGLSEKQADEVIKKIENWIKNLNSDQIISESLKEEVIKEIKQFNESAADMFQWYEETKYNK